MCGLVGLVSHNGICQDHKVSIRNSIKSLNHRGPDGEGHYEDSFCLLAHRRLSIIDLSENGKQPMSCQNGRYWIVFNGEIYNYIEIRKELCQKGYKFRSQTDTEVLLNSFIEWGEECVQKFNGMWAFVIWDSKTKRLFGSRDRFGVKPFYYCLSNGTISFASEIKALRYFSTDWQPDKAQVYRFLASNLYHDNPDTLYENIKLLEPAHSFWYSDVGFKIKRYYDLDSSKASTVKDLKIAVAKFNEIFHDSVRLRLRSDVPVGISLSGGLDSSAIASSVHNHNLRNIHCYTTTFTEKEFTEEEWAKIVVDHYDFLWHPITTNPDYFYETSAKIIYHLDMPSRHFPTFLYWKLMNEAKQKIKVSLNGQGADEILASQPTLKSLYFLMLLNEVCLNNHPGFTTLKEFFILNYRDILKYIIRMRFPRTQRIYRRFSGLDSIIHPSLKELNRDVTAYEKYPEGLVYLNNVDKRIYFDLFHRTLPPLLHYDDRITMAHGIESRVPFLDYRLVELCWSFSPELKMQKNRNKYILRESLKDILPEPIYNRIDKKGYSSPYGNWLMQPKIRNVILEVMTTKGIQQQEIFDIEAVQKIFFKSARYKHDMSPNLWLFFTTCLWLQENF